MEIFIKYRKSDGLVVGQNYYDEIPQDDEEFGFTNVLPQITCALLSFNATTQTYFDAAPPEQIAARNLEIETQRYIQRTQDGIEAYARLSAEFRLAKLNNLLSEEEHHAIEMLLIPVRDEVLAGQWISAKIKLETLGPIPIGQALYDRLHNQITTYISLNY